MDLPLIIQRFLYRIVRSFRVNRSKTVKRAFPLTILSLAALLGAVAAGTTTSSIRLEIDKTALTTDDTFFVDVYADAGTPVNAIDIRVQFPQKQIAIEGVDTGQSVITLWTKEPYVENGTVVLQGGTYRKGFLGEHLIARVRARAKTSGFAEFSIADSQFVAGDGLGTEVAVNDGAKESITFTFTTEDGTEGTTLRTTASIKIETDINGDGVITMADIHAFMAAWTSQNTIYDFNGDNKMTFRDFAIILADFFFAQ